MDLQALYALGVEISLEGKTHHLYSVYRPPQYKLAPADIHSLLRAPVPTIAAGDWNCKSPAWNSSTTCPNGRILLAEAIARDFGVNGPETPTHYPDTLLHTPDVIDVVVHKGLSNQFVQEVISDELLSDHQPVLLTLQSAPVQVAHPTTTARINWQRFQKALEETTTSRPIVTVEDVDCYSEELTVNIQEALQSATESSTLRSYPTLPFRIKKLIDAKRKVRRQFQQSRCPRLKTKLNKMAEKVKRELRELESDQWEDRIEEADSEITSLHKLCRQLTSSRPPIRPLHHTDGTLRYQAADRAEIFAEHLEKQFTLNPIRNTQHLAAVEQHLREYFSTPLANEEDPIVFSPGMVKQTIRHLKTKKAPGADKISNKALRHFPRRTIAALTRLFNAVMRTGKFPENWKMGLVIMLPKPGKNILKPESYRPITLLPSTSKVFEKLLLQKLLNHTEIRPEQFGFREEHSTTLQVSRILHLLTTALNKKESAAAVFLDMEKAFDRVWHQGLLYKLITVEPSTPPIPRRILHVLASFLEGRRFRVKVEDAHSSEKTMSAGVPQGSCLSPVLYSIYTNDIPAPPETTLALYADDAAYVATSLPTRAQNAVAKLQKALTLLPEWLDNWRLTVNVGKTQAFLIGGARKMPPMLTLYGQKIDWSSQAKYLGVTLDRRLTMAIHAKSAANNARTAISLLRPVLRSRLPLRTKVGIYKTYIRSRLTYAAPAWFALTSERTRTNLRAQQAIALRRATGAPRYVRNSTITRDLKIENLDSFISRLAGNMFTRADNSSHPHLTGIAPYHRRPPDKKGFPRDLLP